MGQFQPRLEQTGSFTLIRWTESYRDGGGGTRMKEDGEALWMVMDCLDAQPPPRLILLALCLAPRSQGLIQRGAAPRLHYSNPPGGASGPITARSEVISAAPSSEEEEEEEEDKRGARGWDSERGRGREAVVLI